MAETFGQFGVSFQETLMQALFTDKQWASQMAEVIDVGYFDVKYLQFLADKYFSYSHKYKTFPTLQLLVTIVKDELKARQAVDDVLCQQVIEFLQRSRTSPNLNDAPFVKDKALEFCRAQAFKRALESAVDLMQTQQYGSAVDLMKQASMVGTAPSIGHDFFEDIEARFNIANRIAVPTGIPELDQREILDGGLAAGEIGCVVIFLCS